MFTGTLIAWVLVRDDFRGKALVNAIIDLPFALPTIVASIVLLSLYGPRSPIGLHLYATRPALIIALAFVTLPFVVRSVQPVLMEIDREAEEAAASLGAGNWTIFRRIILPALRPALLGGAGLAFARAVGEFGSVVLIGGGIPRETEVASQYIAKQIEIDRPASAAAVSVALLLISFAVLFAIRYRDPAEGVVKIALRTAALAYLGALVLVPLGMILFRTFEDGFVAFYESITTPAAIAAISLSLTIVAITVPLNVVFGLVTALALARGNFRGRGLLEAVVDLPFAVSPVIVGVALVLFWGNDGWLGGAFPVIFSLPGMVLATVFVTLPFVVREVEPVLREIGTEQEEAATTLGASKFQTFWRITLPAIRVGVAYGVVLTVARALGEFGAVIVVAGGVAGESQTLTLLVHSRYIDDHNVFGAYAASTMLMGLAVITLVLMTLLQRKRA